MNEQDWQIRVDLAAAFRLAAYFDLHEGIDNHFTVALDERGERYLLNPFGLHWSELKASDLIEVDAEGRVLAGEGEAEESAVCIHGPIHRRHPQGRCVLHTHMPYATALTCLEQGRLEPVHQNALRFYGDVAYDPEYNGLAEDAAEGDRIAGALGDKRVLFLGNHGVLVVGPSIAQAFDDLYYLEQACRVQVLAMSTGRPLKRITDNVAANTKAEFDAGGSYAEPHFAALKRLLDAEDPGYAA